MAELQTSRLSPVEKGRLIGYFENGMSQRHIARRLNRSIQTVNLWIQRFQNVGVQGLSTRARSGRPRVTTVEEDMAIITACK